ncbi:MAG: GIY-YIG nuclease family protein [Leptolyngbyaceae cyanobacterium SM1_3_5]|nr:GIY-YIG nuclease family protein [Leptolyngbyaceae cyanobacterium SM1_3_5]
MVHITQLKLLPKVSGVYKVVDADGSVIYIGQAKNIHDRWNSGHHKLSEIISRYGLAVHITWVELPEWLLNRAENAAVSFYQPKLNLKTPPVV